MIFKLTRIIEHYHVQVNIKPVTKIFIIQNYANKKSVVCMYYDSVFVTVTFLHWSLSPDSDIQLLKQNQHKVTVT